MEALLVTLVLNGLLLGGFVAWLRRRARRPKPAPVPMPSPERRRVHQDAQ